MQPPGLIGPVWAARGDAVRDSGGVFGRTEIIKELRYLKNINYTLTQFVCVHV